MKTAKVRAQNILKVIMAFVIVFGLSIGSYNSSVVYAVSENNSTGKITVTPYGEDPKDYKSLESAMEAASKVADSSETKPITMEVEGNLELNGNATLTTTNKPYVNMIGYEATVSKTGDCCVNIDYGATLDIKGKEGTSGITFDGNKKLANNIYVAGSLIISDGVTIKTANTNGVAVSNGEARFIMKGGRITDNHDTSFGGG